MHFAIQKEVVLKAMRDVSNAVATRVVQPILNNLLVESVGTTAISLRATDLDLAIETKAPAIVYAQGAITLPAKKLLEIVSKLPNELIVFQVNKESLETSVTCQRSKFSVTGLASDDFPGLVDARSQEGILMPIDILRRSIVQTSFAAASYDATSVLGGVYLVIENGTFECAATDGSRLAHRKEQLNISVPVVRHVDAENEKESKSTVQTLEKPVMLKATIPARALTELIKLLDSKEPAKLKSEASKSASQASNEVRLSLADGQIIFETESYYLSTRLISGDYPQYRELFPTEYKYLCTFKRQDMVEAVERVSVMSDERTHLIKIHFENDSVQITANTPDLGRALEELPVRFEGQVLDVAINVRYLLDVLQRLQSEEMQLEMTGPLKPLIVKAVGDESYEYLLMPVQSR